MRPGGRNPGSVAVGFRLERAGFRNADIAGLLGRELGQLGANLLEIDFLDVRLVDPDGVDLDAFYATAYASVGIATFIEADSVAVKIPERMPPRMITMVNRPQSR